MLVTCLLHLEVYKCFLFGRMRKCSLLTHILIFGERPNKTSGKAKGSRGQKMEDVEGSTICREWKNTSGHLHRSLWRLVLHKQKLEKIHFFVIIANPKILLLCAQLCFSVLGEVIA